MSDDRLTDLDARVQALSRAREHLACQLDTIQTEQRRLRERLATLESLVAPDPENVTYEQLTRPQKVRRVREALVRKAMTQNGKAKLEYTDVQWLFDGHPSPGHSYDLMKLAGEAKGFRYEEPDSRSNRVVVERDAVNDPALLHGANNAHDDEGV